MRQSNYKADTNSASKHPAKTASKYGNYGSDTYTAARKNVRRNVKRSLKDYEDELIEESDEIAELKAIIAEGERLESLGYDTSTLNAINRSLLATLIANR